MGQAIGGSLAGLKDWMIAHNAVMMTVLCLIIAAKLIGDAISGLAGQSQADHGAGRDSVRAGRAPGLRAL